jgi:hypothetical protein
MLNYVLKEKTKKIYKTQNTVGSYGLMSEAAEKNT